MIYNLYKAVMFYAQNKSRYDELLASNNADMIQSNETNIEKPSDEEDDIYFTRPEDVRRVLRLTNRGLTRPNRSGSITEENSVRRASTVSVEDMEGEYVLSK